MNTYDLILKDMRRTNTILIIGGISFVVILAAIVIAFKRKQKKDKNYETS